MNVKMDKKAGLLIVAAVTSAMAASTANATHFRGAALVPSVSATGELTVSSKSFWRLQAGTPVGSFPHSGVTVINVSGVGNVADDPAFISQDVTDSRRAEVNEIFTTQLPGAGLYTISWSNSSWVSGVPNASGGYGTTSTIFWDGQNASTPIQFDLENIQQQAVAGIGFSDNLDAVGTGLTYDDAFLARGMSRQATGFSIDASGQINIDAASVDSFPDASTTGSDQAFSGKILAGDANDPDSQGSVEFVWLFDKVDTGSNFAPEITDVIVNALVGDTVSETLVVNDLNPSDTITASFIGLNGIGGSIGGSTFNPNTLEFNWNTSGFAPGTYVATFGASDGSLTDQGTVTINLSARPPGGGNPTVNEPGTLAIIGAGLLGLAGMRRKRKAK